MADVVIPEAFAQYIREVFREQADPWLAALPGVVAELSERWEITVGSPVTNLSYNWVAPAFRAGGERTMLKIGVPNDELSHEIAALRHYDGRGISRLLDADAERGALLLERVEPGTTLIEVSLRDDDEATRITADVICELARPAPETHTGPTVERWHGAFARLRSEFAGESGPFDEAVIERAEHLYADLQSSAGSPLLLHGDLHHDNILRASDTGRAAWLAIDPKGVVGELAYETSALFRNPIPHIFTWPDLERTTERRAAILSEALGIDRQRLLGWAYYGMVLSALWTREDEGHGWEPMIECAQAVARVMSDE
jgi:streptomycin 6-kinase